MKAFIAVCYSQLKPRVESTESLLLARKTLLVFSIDLEPVLEAVEFPHTSPRVTTGCKRATEQKRYGTNGTVLPARKIVITKQRVFPI